MKVYLKAGLYMNILPLISLHKIAVYLVISILCFFEEKMKVQFVESHRHQTKMIHWEKVSERQQGDSWE